YPGHGGACTATCESRDRRLPPCNGRSLTPVPQPVPGIFSHEASARVHWHSPTLSLPSPVIPRTVRTSLGFPRASHPAEQDPAAHARAGTGLRRLPGVTLPH